MSNEHPDYITITYGMRGYFAVHLSWDKECGFYTPWQSGFGSYEHPRNVVQEGLMWAENEGIEFRDVDHEELVRSVERSAARSDFRHALIRERGMDMREAFRMDRTLEALDGLAQAVARLSEPREAFDQWDGRMIPK